MKKIIPFFVFVIIHFSLFAQFTGNIQTQSSELSFSKGNAYDIISLKGGVTTTQIGAPQLPIKMISYVIPYDKKVISITINNSTYQVLTDTFLIFPFQPPRATNDTNTHIFTEPDSLLYGSNNPYPDSLVKIVFQGNNMGYNIVTLYFYPVQYIPLVKQVKLFTSIQFTLNYASNSDMPILPQKQSEYMNNITKNFIKSLISNPNDLQIINGGPLQIIGNNNQQTLNLKSMPVLESDIPAYIIITNNNDINGQILPSYNGKNMTQIFQQLADWKTQKGVPTLVVTTDEIALNYHGCDLAEKIRNYLKEVYAKWGSKYVLLGGDVNIIPARLVDIDSYASPELDPTDLYYSTIEGDWNANHDNLFGNLTADNVDITPEFFLGRASTENCLEANTFITKVLQYEKLNVTPNINYVNNLLFIAGELGYPNKPMNIFTQIANSITYPTTLNKCLLFDNYILYQGSEELSRTAALNRLSNGIPAGKTHLVFHLDHSGWDGMGTSSTIKGEVIANIDMDGLNNAPYHQILFTNGCSPNSFQKDCITERYINNPIGGGVAIIGASTTAYVGESEFLSNFVSAIYNFGNVALHNSNIGVAFTSTYPPEYSTAKMKYNLLGDPEMPVWTTTPHNFIVTAPTSISNVNNQATITITGSSIFEYNNITVCLQKGNEIYQTQIKFCTPGQTETFIFTVNPETAGTMIATVTGHDYIPVVKNIAVNIIGRNLFILSKTITDNLFGQNGNNNQKLDAGENIELDFVLKNNGTLNMLGVFATLQSSSPNIIIQQTTSSFGTINAGQSQINATKYHFNVNNNAEDGEIANFSLLIQETPSYSVSRNFNLQIEAPKLIKGINTYTTAINNDMIIDAGDQVSLYIDLLNDGNSDARVLTAKLSSTSPNITITQANTTYPDIPHFIKKRNIQPFQFNVNNAYTNEPLTLTVQNIYGKTWSFNFTLKKPTSTINNITYENTSTSIELFWNPIVSNCSGYNIYRSNSPNGTFIKINQQPVLLSTYLDNGLTPKTKYYYKISYLDNDGNESEKSNTVLAWTNYPYHTGWPVSPLADLGAGNEGTPNVIDIDADGNKEIFFTSAGISGSILAFKHNGTELYDIDNNPNTVSGFALPKIHIAGESALGEINNDGKVELIISTHNWNDITKRKLFAYSTTGDVNGDHKPDLLWTAITGGSNLRGAVLSDMDNNTNTLECFPNTMLNSGNQLSIFNNTGSIYQQIAIDGSDKKFDSYSAMSAIADIDNDGNKEIVEGNMSGLYVFNKNVSGSYIQKWVNNTGCNNPNEYQRIRMDSPPVLADIDNDGYMEIIFLRMKMAGFKCIVDIMRHDGSFQSGWGNDNHFCDYYGSITDDSELTPMISVGDINNDGHLEIVVGSHNGIRVWDSYGNPFASFSTNNTNKKCDFSCPLIADIDGDDEMEIVVTLFDPYISNNTNRKIYAYNLDGSMVDYFPLNSGSSSTPCIADIDNDGKNEIISVGGGKLHVWDTEGDSRKIEWGQIRSDAQNTGVYHKNNCQFASNGTPININGSEVWSDYKRVNTTVTINSGGSLGITCRIDFTELAKIIVKPGGSLIINGGKLTSACNGQLWQGVEVWGNYFLSQHENSDQGHVTIYNGGTIENALTGIATLNESNTARGGGIIEADGAKFINNRTAIKMQAYQNFAYDNPTVKLNDESYFRNCEFKTTGALNDAATLFDAFVDIQGINGINFGSCTFANPENGANAFTGTGIRSTNSSFRVMGDCREILQPGQECPYEEAINYSTFRNLSYGVHADNYSLLKPITINLSKFENNGKGGIYIGGSVGCATITRNLLKVKEINLDPQNINVPYGIYFDNSTGYKCEGNKFDKVNDGAQTQGGEGLIINNSGGSYNIVYNNEFNNLYCATNAQNNNRFLSDPSSPGTPVIGPGLKIKCNDYSDGINSNIGVTPNGAPGISTSQGENPPSYDPTAPAGNTFTQNAYQLNNGGGFFTYKHHAANVGNLILIPTTYTANKVALNNTMKSYVDKQTSCPSTIAVSSSGVSYEHIATAQQSLNSARLMLTIWVDGGNTQALKDAVNLSYPWEAFELYNKLISESPYLSDEVMVNAIQREDAFPALLLKYVLLANPQSAKSDAVMRALTERLNPLPKEWVEEIREGAEVVSPREQLESNVAYYFQDRQTTVNQLKRWYLADTTVTYGGDSLQLLLENDIEPISDYQLAYLNIEKGNFDACDSVMANIPNKYAYKENEMGYHQDFIDFFAIIKDMHENDKTIYELSKDQINTLKDLPHRVESYTSAYARAILLRLEKDMVYNEPVLLPDENNKLKMAKAGNKTSLKPENLLKAYPNPAKDYFIVEYQLTEEINHAVIEIVDAMGRKLQSIALYNKKDQIMINTHALSSGFYNCILLNNGKILSQTKISVE